MQTPDVAAPPATMPQIPSPPPPPARVTITTTEGGQPITISVPRNLTAADLRAIRTQRSELSDQLTSAARRRANLAEEIRRTPDGPSKQGLEARMTQLDQRILQLEGDIARTGQVLSSTEAARVMSGPVPGGDEEEAFMGGMAIGASVIIGFLGVRRFVRGRRRRDVQQGITADQSAQLTRLEQAVDAIAIEVERISEGQRFTAKLMAETSERARRELVPRNAE